MPTREDGIHATPNFLGTTIKAVGDVAHEYDRFGAGTANGVLGVERFVGGGSEIFQPDALDS